MLISHEVPVSLLKESRNFNDYDYCLLHLTYEIPEYTRFYKESSREGRKILLDNSMYELGDSLTNEQLAEGVLNIRPTWYVVPDCFNNKDVTIERYLSFEKTFKDLPGTAIGVVHGSTKKDLIECYKFMSEHAGKIAIPFGSTAYSDYSDSENILQCRSEGRIRFIQELMNSGLFNYNKPHHLLGCNLAWEFSSPIYREPAIESLDTSNPVIFAIEGMRYPENILDTPKVKSTVKMCDIINTPIIRDSRTYEDIKYNIEKFREMCS